MAGETSVTYHVRVDPTRHEINVVVTLEGSGAEGTIYVETPTWVPGDYAFSTYGRDVFAVHATDPHTSQPLSVRRTGWQGYEISGASGAAAIAYTTSCTSTEFTEAAGTVRDDYAAIP